MSCGSHWKQSLYSYGVEVIIPMSPIRITHPDTHEEVVLVKRNDGSSGSRPQLTQPPRTEVVQSTGVGYSHFISLPLSTNRQFVDNLINFQNSILADPKLKIDQSIFSKPQSLHLTLLMLDLGNPERVNAAVKIFKGIEAEVRKALDGLPLSIKLKGLKLMSGTPEKACVLYAPVVGDDNRLLDACKVIKDAFIQGGLVPERDAGHTLLLHATVMNARFRKRANNTQNSDSFDAREIMKLYGSKEWGEFVIPELHLSQRGVFDNNGYYHCCATLPLPQNTRAE